MKTFGAEVYTKDKPNGQTGWDIKFIETVAHNKAQALEILKQWPLFDVVILWDYAIETDEEVDGVIRGLTGHRGETKEILFRVPMIEI